MKRVISLLLVCLALLWSPIVHAPQEGENQPCCEYEDAWLLQ